MADGTHACYSTRFSVALHARRRVKQHSFAENEEYTRPVGQFRSIWRHYFTKMLAQKKRECKPTYLLLTHYFAKLTAPLAMPNHAEANDDVQEMLARIAPEQMAELVCSIRGEGHDPEFWKGLDDRELRQKFENAQEEDFEQIRPVWDLRQIAYHEHSDLDPKYLVGGVLYVAPRDRFLSYHSHTDIYEYATFRDKSNFSQILRVIGHWLRGDALTPPVYTSIHGTDLWKWDGHHRTAVAILSKSPLIPFYSQTEINLAGVEPFPDHISRDLPWSP